MQALVLLLLILFYPNFTNAQIVTASIDPTELSFNPAATGFRVFSGGFTRYDYNTTKTTGTETGSLEDYGFSNLDADWTIEDKIHSYKLLAAGQNYWIVPAVLYNKQSIETKYTRVDNKGIDPINVIENSMDISNLHANLAIKPFSFLSLGIHYAKADLVEKRQDNYKIGGGESNSETTANITMTGRGGGVTIKVPGNIYLAYSYAQYDLDIDATGTSSGSYGSSTFNRRAINKFKLATYGIAYMVGKKKSKSFRVEISEKLNSTDIARLHMGRRRTFSVEAMTKKLYGGFSVMSSRGDRVNFQNIVDAVTGERVNTNEESLSFTGSGGFRTSKGHSIGGSLSYSNINIKSQISSYNEDNLFESNIENIAVGASYAYIF